MIQRLRRTIQILILFALFVIPVVGEYENLLAKTGSPYQMRRKIQENWAFNFIHNLRGRSMRMERRFPIKGDLWWSFTLRTDAIPIPFAQSDSDRSATDILIADPLGILSTLAANRGTLEWFVLARALPLALLALILGRVFCGWLCPVGFILEIAQMFRKLLDKLGIVMIDVRFPRWTKYVVLGICVSFAWWGVRLSEWIYGPRVIAGEANNLAVLQTVKIGVPILLAVFLFELLVSKRWLCRTVCPGGALYSLLSIARIFKVKYEPSNCVACNKCLPVCTMGLEPNLGKLGPECDGCGSCIGACNSSALKYGIELPKFRRAKAVGAVTAALLVFWLLAGEASAHHVQGVNTDYANNYRHPPAYDKMVNSGGYDIRFTYRDIQVDDESAGYVMGVYIQIKDDTKGLPYTGPVELVIVGEKSDADPALMTAPNSSNIYNFRCVYKVKGEYEAKVRLLEAPDAQASFRISMIEKGISTPVIIISGCAVLVVLLIQVVAYVKRSRPVVDP